MKKGFTLVELIASLAIFSMVMVAISMAFFASLNIRQANDVKLNTAGYAQAITENFRSKGYDKLDSLYKGNMITGVSTFVYFNDIATFNLWFQNFASGVTQITGNVGLSTYPLSTGFKFGALIKVEKKSIIEVSTYHIYVRVWQLSKGAKSQSVRDIYESR